MELPKYQSPFRHFIHEHPLECSERSPTSQEVSCSCCRLRVSAENGGWSSCKACSFFLHGVCLGFPPKVRHDSHPDHSLVLDSAPEGMGRATRFCRACESLITGFYYSCTACEVLYHPLCLSLPLSISINCHPHLLQLEFSLGYEFRCDMCNKPGYKGWLYRCGWCELEVHLGCAFSKITKLEMTNLSIGNIPCDETTGRELLQLLTEQFLNVEKGSGGSLARGWLEIAKSPGGMNFMPCVAIVSPAGCELTQLMDNKSVLPDISMTPSNQFSDTYFSIDLANPYSSGNNKNNIEKSPREMGPGGPEAKDKVGLIRPATPPAVAGLSDREKKLPRRLGATGTENHTREKNEATGRKSNRMGGSQNGRPNKVADSDIGWRRLFFGCC